MALIPIYGPLIWPERSWEVSNNIARTFNSTGYKFASRIIAPQSGVLDKVRFMTTTSASTGVFRISFQSGDNATGLPNQVYSYYTDTSGLAANAWITTESLTHNGSTTGNKLTVAAGQDLWVVFEFVSHTTGSILIRDATHPAIYAAYQNTYCAISTSGVWVKTSVWGCFDVIYDDGTALPTNGTMAAINSSSATITSTGSVREQGNYFQVPFNCTANGLQATVDHDGNAALVLYSGTTELASGLLYANSRQGGGVGGVMVNFPSVSLATGSVYRMTVRPTSTTGITFREHQSFGFATGTAFAGGTGCYWTEKSNLGVWTQNTKVRGKIWLMIDNIEIPDQPAPIPLLFFTNAV